MNVLPQTILFVHPSDELYGSDRCLLETARSLSASSNLILALPQDIEYEGKLSAAFQELGGTVVYVNMLAIRRALIRPAAVPHLLWRFAVGTRELSRIIRNHQVDVVHSNTLAIVSGASAAQLCRTPHIWHVHEHIGDESAAFRLLIRGMLHASSGVIVANSRSVARALAGRSQHLRRRTLVIRNAVRSDIEPANRPAMPDVPVIGVIGRLSPRKGIVEALRAAAMLSQRGCRFKLRFIGGPPPGEDWRLRTYRELATKYGIAQRVDFAGESDDIPAELARLDIFLMPSQRPEPFGLALIEAMAAGLPVVATENGGGSDEILHHEVDGLYCERAAQDIAGTLERLLTHKLDWADLGLRAQLKVHRNYGVDRYQQAFQHLYREIVMTRL